MELVYDTTADGFHTVKREAIVNTEAALFVYTSIVLAQEHGLYFKALIIFRSLLPSRLILSFNLMLLLYRVTGRQGWQENPNPPIPAKHLVKSSQK